MKLLAGVLQPQAGERLPARDLSIGYFAQSQVEELDGALSPIELLRKAVPSFSEQQARDYLGGFGYSGEMATTPLAPRSGGEKARLALAMLLVHKPNLILLDEPTNHLDLAAREALIRALQEFPGAVVLVSHDRALLEASCERYLRVVQGRVQEYNEDLDSYAELLRREVAETPVGKPSEAPASSAVARSGVDHRERRALQNRLKRVEEQLAQAQQTLGRIETDLAAASGAVSQDAAKLTQLIAARSDAAAKVEALENEWLELAASLEA
jgi:ATP-binding cassette subfamily F protein 3